VTSESSLDIRIVRFLTTLLQNNVVPDNAKSLRGALKGITEIRVDHYTNTYRVYYVAGFECCLYIIDAGMKSRRGAVRSL